MSLQNINIDVSNIISTACGINNNTLFVFFSLSSRWASLENICHNIKKSMPYHIMELYVIYHDHLHAHMFIANILETYTATWL